MKRYREQREVTSSYSPDKSPEVKEPQKEKSLLDLKNKSVRIGKLKGMSQLSKNSYDQKFEKVKQHSLEESHDSKYSLAKSLNSSKLHLSTKANAGIFDQSDKGGKNGS